MKILQINSSLKTNGLYSKHLADALIEKLKENEPNVIVVSRNLNESNLPHFTEAHLENLSNSNPIESQAGKLSDELIDELLNADTIVIGVPMYNFTISSVLKSCIDFLGRAGKTFKYTVDGAIGLVEKKVYLAIATGGIFSEGHFKAFDFTVPYLRVVLVF